MDHEEFKRLCQAKQHRKRAEDVARNSFLGRHGLTIIIVTVAFLTSAVILALVA